MFRGAETRTPATSGSRAFVCAKTALVASTQRSRPRRLSRVADLFPDLSDGLLLQLTDAFARQVVLVADLFQRELVFVVETEAPADDARLDRRESAEQTAYLLRPARRREV